MTACTSLPSFPFAPRATFQLLHKLDLAFCSLLQGVSTETGERLPGCEGGRGKLSTTEKVRMRSLVERTRVAVVEAAGEDSSVLDAHTMSQAETDDDFNMTETDDIEQPDGVGAYRRWEMEIARVYERTIVELGRSLDTAENNWGSLMDEQF